MTGPRRSSLSSPHEELAALYLKAKFAPLSTFVLPPPRLSWTLLFCSQSLWVMSRAPEETQQASAWIVCVSLLAKSPLTSAISQASHRAWSDALRCRHREDPDISESPRWDGGGKTWVSESRSHEVWPGIGRQKLPWASHLPDAETKMTGDNSVGPLLNQRQCKNSTNWGKIDRRAKHGPRVGPRFWASISPPIEHLRVLGKLLIFPCFTSLMYNGRKGIPITKGCWMVK